jgi:predicted RNA-binding protein with PIN domain
MKAGCELLEPYYSFRIELPAVNLGRAMAELQARFAEFEILSNENDIAVLSGRGPVSELHGYPRELTAYTAGKGRMSCVSDGYEVCHNADEIIKERGYDPEADLRNTPHSVFCAHGAGFTVPWNEVDNYKHLTVELHGEKKQEAVVPKASSLAKKYSLSDEELEAIMLRAFGPIKRRQYRDTKTVMSEERRKAPKKKAAKPQHNIVIVDGYNVIFAWESLKSLAEKNLDDARESLMTLLANYVGFTKAELVLVFDAYLVKDGQGSDFERDGYRVVYTKHEQTADAFIEKLMHELGPDYSARVVTADRLVQCSAVNSGILRMTPREFADELTAVGNEINEFVRKYAEMKN